MPFCHGSHGAAIEQWFVSIYISSVFLPYEKKHTFHCITFSYAWILVCLGSWKFCGISAQMVVLLTVMITHLLAVPHRECMDLSHLNWSLLWACSVVYGSLGVVWFEKMFSFLITKMASCFYSVLCFQKFILEKKWKLVIIFYFHFYFDKLKKRKKMKHGFFLKLK